MQLPENESLPVSSPAQKSKRPHKYRDGLCDLLARPFRDLWPRCEMKVDRGRVIARGERVRQVKLPEMSKCLRWEMSSGRNVQFLIGENGARCVFPISRKCQFSSFNFLLRKLSLGIDSYLNKMRKIFFGERVRAVKQSLISTGNSCLHTDILVSTMCCVVDSFLRHLKTVPKYGIPALETASYCSFPCCKDGQEGH